ncbi:MAG: radical SAM family heme chaperone HemW [Deltaproteobacteria bacterium]|nr:radical SAM family heme chaperone HemW [Deltaproteobacteria bacterium]
MVNVCVEKLKDSVDFGIYIHYPLCRRRCGYCDFATLRDPDFPHVAYTQRVLQEAEFRGEQFKEWPLRSIYFGGGSPSLWASREMAQVVAGLRSMFTIARDGVEVTVECNPQDVGRRELAGFVEAGINRLSVGAQSFDDEMLHRLTREHDTKRTRRCIMDARKVGFENLSIDLIYGLRGQDTDHHLEQLEQLLAFTPEHVSVYALTLAAEAPLRKAGEGVVDDDASAGMLLATVDFLGTAGYAHYEVSNFAQEGRTSAHNEGVWRGRPYLGLGANAHSMLWNQGRNVRCANPESSRYMNAPMQRSAPMFHVRGAELEELSTGASRHEMLMLGMRTRRGVKESEYEARFGGTMDAHFGAALNQLQAEGLLRKDQGAWCPSTHGMFFADAVALRLASP